MKAKNPEVEKGRYKIAGSGFRADFKPAAKDRIIVFADKKQVQEVLPQIEEKFAGAFRILAQ